MAMQAMRKKLQGTVVELEKEPKDQYFDGLEDEDVDQMRAAALRRMEVRNQVKRKPTKIMSIKVKMDEEYTPPEPKR